MTESPLLIDLETRSIVNLKTDGSWKYAEHPSTSLLTAAWSVDGVYGIWLPTVNFLTEAIRKVHFPTTPVFLGPTLPKPLSDNLHKSWVGHNSWTFDQLVWDFRYPKPAEWLDSYPLALQHGLPGALDAIGKRLGCGGKEETGKARLGKFTKDFTKVPALMDCVLIGKYNQHDVVILEKLWEYIQHCPKQPSTEFKVLKAHRTINERGCRVDVKLMRAMRDLSDHAIIEAVKSIDVLTDHAIPDLDTLRKRDKVLGWVREQGIDTTDNTKLDSIAKDSVSSWIDRLEGSHGASIEELISEGQFNTKGIQLLLLRQSAMRVTGAKIDAGISGVRNGRLQGLYAYHGALTGRWSGRKIMLHNLTRPKITVPVWKLVDLYEETGGLPVDRVNQLLDDQFIKVRDSLSPQEAKLLRRATLDDAGAAMLRAIFLPEIGYKLAMADYAAIEARGLAWFAGDEKLLDCFINDVCPYSAIAAKLFGRFPTSKKDPIRHVGKTIELGCGYGMGARKFKIYGGINNIDFDELGITPQACVDVYRASHSAIAGEIVGEYNGVPFRRNGLWHKLDGAAKQALNEGTVHLGPLTFKYDGQHLRVKLPCNRFLTYSHARIEPVAPSYDTDKLVDSFTYHPVRGDKRVSMHPGKWAENIVQASMRDVLAEALVRLEDSDFKPPIHVHDEGTGNVDTEERFDQFMREFTQVPTWCPELPLDAEGGVVPRYGKTVKSGGEVVYRNGQYKSGSIEWPS